MRIATNRFRLLLAVLLGANLLAVVAFIVSRRPLDAEGWSFLERQRPVVQETADGATAELFMVADGLNFALARRPIGGWETPSVRIFQLVNLPAFVAALAAFHTLQTTPGGSSKRNSDLATLVFAIVFVAQWSGLSLLLSRRSPEKRNASLT